MAGRAPGDRPVGDHPDGEGARLVLLHRPLRSEPAIDYSAGWHLMLDALAVHLDGGDPATAADFDALFATYAAAASGRQEGPGGPAGTLRLTRELSARPEHVWRAFTEPAVLAAWFWPQRFATTVEADLRVGGRYRIEGPGAAMAVGGEYVVVEPLERLAFTWRWDGAPAETLVTLHLAAAGEGTELTVVHEGFPDEADRDEHAKGWSDCLGRLPEGLRYDSHLSASRP